MRPLAKRGGWMPERAKASKVFSSRSLAARAFWTEPCSHRAVTPLLAFRFEKPQAEVKSGKSRKSAISGPPKERLPSRSPRPPRPAPVGRRRVRAAPCCGRSPCARDLVGDRGRRFPGLIATRLAEFGRCPAEVGNLRGIVPLSLFFTLTCTFVQVVL